MAIMKKYAMGGAVTTTSNTTKKPTGFKKTKEDILIEKNNKGRASGVAISKEDQKKHAKDFEYLTKKKAGGSVKKAKSGASVKKCKNGCK